QSERAGDGEVSRRYTGNVGVGPKHPLFQAIESARLHRFDETADYVAHLDEHGSWLLLRTPGPMVLVGLFAHRNRDGPGCLGNRSTESVVRARCRAADAANTDASTAIGAPFCWP